MGTKTTKYTGAVPAESLCVSFVYTDFVSIRRVDVYAILKLVRLFEHMATRV